MHQPPSKAPTSPELLRGPAPRRRAPGAALALLLAAASLLLPPPAAAAAWWQPKASEGLVFSYDLGRSGDSIPDALASKSVIFLDGESTSAAAVDAVHAGGAKAVCYFSAGSVEKCEAPAGLRMSDCAAKGFDAVDPDNVDGWDGNDTGFQISAADQIAYNTWLATTAHGLGLGCGLKNDVNQIADLAPSFDFFVNEQCMQYEECGMYSPALKANKPVFNIEYKSKGFTRSCRCQALYGLTTNKANLKLTKQKQCPAKLLNSKCPYSSRR
ncbi:hypothetical protein Rsub_06934 [Raphidocelis subcapitata]|uniref:Glycoside-hydrolase family GH114 TIM-barrel domain-containing protein n=1 Tax=Raphidocelis subcapitata TaxID=307507 RepID=A0A2V0P5V5_9CHLO|nr:hypothetical protein Rsub_06934 [Raphidocelis subcapitata]|eukprot:GBF94312.1 hypothetical protein Rsub_06934 [Raphidocelis subcapitata]